MLSQNKIKTLIHSKIHPAFKLETVFHPSKNSKNLYFLREDLIHPSIPGSKVRKLASIFQHIKENGIERIHAGGSFYSNNLIAISYFSKDLNIPATLYVKESHQKELKGNARKLIHRKTEKSDLKIISKSEWPNVNDIMHESASKKDLVIPEGAFMKEAVPGLFTLGMDLIQFCQDRSIENLFLDAG